MRAQQLEALEKVRKKKLLRRKKVLLYNKARVSSDLCSRDLEEGREASVVALSNTFDRAVWSPD